MMLLRDLLTLTGLPHSLQHLQLAGRKASFAYAGWLPKVESRGDAAVESAPQRSLSLDAVVACLPQRAPVLSSSCGVRVTAEVLQLGEAVSTMDLIKYGITAEPEVEPVEPASGWRSVAAKRLANWVADSGCSSLALRCRVGRLLSDTGLVLQFPPMERRLSLGMLSATFNNLQDLAIALATPCHDRGLSVRCEGSECAAELVIAPQPYEAVSH